MEMENRILMEDDNKNTVALSLLEELRFQGSRYLLAEEEGEGTCYVLKEVEQNEKDAYLVFVEEEKELDAVFSLFQQFPAPP